MMLDQIKHMRKLSEINSKHSESRTLDEKRFSYADEVFSFYRIDNEIDKKLFKQTFSFDNNGLGRTKINNLSLAIRNDTNSDYYTSQGKSIIFKKLFECLEINKDLKGEFRKEHYDKFLDFIKNGKMIIGEKETYVAYVFNSLFPDVKITTSTWTVKNLLTKEFGLSIKNVEIMNSEGEMENDPWTRNSKTNHKEYLMNIPPKSAAKLLKFYSMANPYSDAITVTEELESDEFMKLFKISDSNLVIQDFESGIGIEEQPYYYFDSIDEAIEGFDEFYESQKVLDEVH
jgi:hypothetical protein